MYQVMDWQRLKDEGHVVEYEGAKPLAKPHIADGWKCCVKARELYSEAEYEAVDRELREALRIAAEAFCYYDDLRPAREPTTLEFVERLCLEFWREEFTARIFDRAYILRGMLPLPKEPLPEEEAAMVRRSISAATEFVAMIDSYVYM